VDACGHAASVIPVRSPDRPASSSRTSPLSPARVRDLRAPSRRRPGRVCSRHGPPAHGSAGCVCRRLFRSHQTSGRVCGPDPSFDARPHGSP
jgi:hypothetical protein